MLTMEKKLSSRGSWISIDNTNVHCWYCHDEICDLKIHFLSFVFYKELTSLCKQHCFLTLHAHFALPPSCSTVLLLYCPRGTEQTYTGCE